MNWWDTNKYFCIYPHWEWQYQQHNELRETIKHKRSAYAPTCLSNIPLSALEVLSFIDKICIPPHWWEPYCSQPLGLGLDQQIQEYSDISIKYRNSIWCWHNAVMRHCTTHDICHTQMVLSSSLENKAMQNTVWLLVFSHVGIAFCTTIVVKDMTTCGISGTDRMVMTMKTHYAHVWL